MVSYCPACGNASIAVVLGLERAGRRQAEIAGDLGRRTQRGRFRNGANTLYRSFLDRLRAFRVVDPACGSGNFLYLALLALKDIEHLSRSRPRLWG